jgi:hypothetical protein
MHSTYFAVNSDTANVKSKKRRRRLLTLRELRDKKSSNKNSTKKIVKKKRRLMTFRELNDRKSSNKKIVKKKRRLMTFRERDKKSIEKKVKTNSIRDKLNDLAKNARNRDRKKKMDALANAAKNKRIDSQLNKLVKSIANKQLKKQVQISANEEKSIKMDIVKSEKNKTFEVVNQYKRSLKFLNGIAPNTDKNRLLLFQPNYPSITLGHKDYVKQVTANFSRFKWAVPSIKNSCQFSDGPITLSNTQNFIRHFITPRSVNKGILLSMSTGGGKTCTGVALSDNFPRVIWVTKRNLIPGLWNAMFVDLCSGIMREWKKMGRPIPKTIRERLAILAHQGTKWILPMSYRQFSNALRPGNPTAIGKQLIKTSPKGSKDPLANAMVIIDESHLLYDKNKLPTVQQPNMKYIENALERSYKLSKSDSVKVTLMTATPATDVMILFKQLNLIIPKSTVKLPIKPKDIMSKFSSKDGKVTVAGAKLLLLKTKGLVSYLNSQKDPSKFAQIVRQPEIKVTMSELQTKKVQACTSKSIKNPGKCIQKKLNVAERKATDSFDSVNFDADDFNERMPRIAPKIAVLLKQINILDAADRKRTGHTYKHLIFSDVRGGYGAKFIASALVASGKYNMIVKSGQTKLIVDTTKVPKKRNIAILTTTGLYGSSGKRLSFSNKIVVALVDKKEGVYNKESNKHGDQLQILIASDDFAVGVDAFDTRYIHIFNTQISQTNLTQVEGRGTRFCGSTNLEFKKNKGWELFVYTYVSEWNSASDKTNIGKGQSPVAFMRDQFSGIDLPMMKLNNHIANVLFTSSVDYNLNAAINLGQNI